ncbi:pilus assembly protein TadG-related protein [Haloechinothrix halophila]|uniref:pilus assembly protein TadG-related protein n=1 Tax=Haloechinothrix halophila TaxID=1069073 RepID=UPI0004101462|nr:pilus assembly protein TadG-related protein [Haloechinothrix halophila]
MTRTHTPRYAGGDDGSVSVMVAVLVPALLLMIALVVDGAGQLRAISRADAVAAEAARAAQTALDTRGATVTIDTNAAVAAARSYLAQAGHTGRVSVTGPDTVTVSVSVTVPAAIGLGGPTHHATGTATARLGVAQPPGAGR